MLLTPRIIRTHDLRAQDLSPIYIGTQSNMSLTGPPATISAPPEPDAAAQPQAAAPAAAAPGTPTAPTAAPVAPARSAAAEHAAAGRAGVADRQHAASGRAAGQLADSRHGAGTDAARRRSRRATSPCSRRTPEPAAPAAPAPAPAAPAPSPAPGCAADSRRRLRRPASTLSPPSEMRVGSGPYTIPISIAGATRLSTLTLSITYNPALVRVRNVQEGTFMRQGGATPAFSSQIDDKSGRIDIVITRPGDKTGASTAGLLAALLVEPLTAGTGSLGAVGFGDASRRRRGGAAVPAGRDYGAVARTAEGEGTADCERSAALRSSSCWSSRRSC